MNRQPEPDWRCPLCRSYGTGDYCSTCEMSLEEADRKKQKLMQERADQFIEKCIEWGVLRESTKNTPSKDLEELTVRGEVIKLVPRFSLSIPELLEVPGVQDVYADNRGNGLMGIFVRYEPDNVKGQEEKALEMEAVQRFLNRFGPIRTARLLGKYKHPNQDHEIIQGELGQREEMDLKVLDQIIRQ